MDESSDRSTNGIQKGRGEEWISIARRLVDEAGLRTIKSPPVGRWSDDVADRKGHELALFRGGSRFSPAWTPENIPVNRPVKRLSKRKLESRRLCATSKIIRF